MAKVTFMPEGNPEFDELEPGEKMQMRCTVEKEKDGQACVVSVDGVTLPEYEDEEEEETDESEDDRDMMAMMDEQM